MYNGYIVTDINLRLPFLYVRCFHRVAMEPVQMGDDRANYRSSGLCPSVPGSSNKLVGVVLKFTK
jgi:hypothetical protein